MVGAVLCVGVVGLARGGVALVTSLRFCRQSLAWYGHGAATGVSQTIALFGRRGGRISARRYAWQAGDYDGKARATPHTPHSPWN